MQKERKRTVRGRLQRECCKGEPQTECDRHTRLVLITYYRSGTVKVKKRAQKRAREKTKQLFPLFSLQHLHLSSSYEVLLTLVVAFCCSSNLQQPSASLKVQLQKHKVRKVTQKGSFPSGSVSVSFMDHCVCLFVCCEVETHLTSIH